MTAAIECSGLPGLMKIYFNYISDEFAMIGMEYCSNGSLEKYVNNAKENSEERVKSFTKQILSAMHNLNEKGIVHRDIRPENIILDEFGRLKLTDYGLTVNTNYQSKEFAETRAGTRRYSSPELVDGMPQSEKSDVWALGVILLELAYGRDDYEDSEITEMDCSKIKGEFEAKICYSNEMAEFLSRCFERKSADRATIEELLKHEWLNEVDLSLIGPTKKSGNNN